MEFQDWRQTGHKGTFTSLVGQRTFRDVLWGLEEFTCHILSSRLILHSLFFVPLHSDNSRKTELLLCLTQLIRLKLTSQEEYLMKHLSVIAHWNRNKKIYKMGWLKVIFSGLRKHGAQFTIFPH